MKETEIHPKLPTDWNEREKLRDKGQFWTPPRVARTMVEYVIGNSRILFDPAAGEGAFYHALKTVRPEGDISFYGTDIDKNVLDNEIYKDGACITEVRDFLFNPPSEKFPAIVANPPYIRHHRLTEKIKSGLKEITRGILGFSIDGRAGLHIYFLIRALNLLEEKGRLAFIMPADTAEGIFANALWTWITAHFRLECVITFSSQAAPFPNVDTNALIFLIRNERPESEILWVKSHQSNSDGLREFVASGFRSKDSTLEIMKRRLDEALQTGLSRPRTESESEYRLSDFASVMRGIATGANDFFYLTKAQVKDLKLGHEFLRSAIGRTRDVKGNRITEEMLTELDKKGRPTLLFSPDSRHYDEFPEHVRNYLLYGESLEISKRSLIRTRTPWYKMEKRTVPKFLFAYLGRRNSRFIRNDAGVVPLSCLLCVYPHSDDHEFVNRLWEVLDHIKTVRNLSLVGKSYGSGAIKVEPRALENLQLPKTLTDKAGLIPSRRQERKRSQLLLFEG